MGLLRHHRPHRERPCSRRDEGLGDHLPQDRGGDQRPPEGVRDFLDSHHGRHFADGVADELGKGETLRCAIDAAVARWQGWRIDRRTGRDAGIPHGLPYLTGLANRFAIMAELSS